MTYRILSFIVALILSSCLQSPKTSEITEPTIFDNAELLGSVKGNFKGENTNDTAEIFHIVERDSTTTSNGRYILIINRKDSTLFESHNKLSHLTLEGDINNDGRDEVGVYIERSGTTWGEYVTMCFSDTWHNVTTTTLNLRLMEELGTQLKFDEIVSRDSLHNDQIIVRRPQIHNANEIVIVEEII